MRRGWSWIGEERIAIGAKPGPGDMARLADDGVTHIVNCRARQQHAISQDLWAEREAFGADRVAIAPMWDHGRGQDPERWVAAVDFAIAALEDDPAAKVLIHCQQGRRRSALVAYAILRLRGRSPEEAARVILQSRPVARIVPAYRASVEAWLANHRAASLP